MRWKKRQDFSAEKKSNWPHSSKLDSSESQRVIYRGSPTVTTDRHSRAGEFEITPKTRTTFRCEYQHPHFYEGVLTCLGPNTLWFRIPAMEWLGIGNVKLEHPVAALFPRRVNIIPLAIPPTSSCKYPSSLWQCSQMIVSEQGIR